MDTRQEVDFVGSTVDHYAIVALIQAGAQGRVYRGRDERLQRDVAIKVLKPEPVPHGATGGLIAEARLLSRLNHPHVASVYDFVTQDDRDFMVMEFVAGATLQEVLAAGPLPVHEVIRLGVQLARGLDAAHRANVVHRDIKPANLRITSSGDLKILDFGIANLLPQGVTTHDSATATGIAIVGTVPYMAPEILRGETADARSDLFAAGAVIYEMATGLRAFRQRDLVSLVDAIQDDEPERPSSVNPAVPLARTRDPQGNGKAGRRASVERIRAGE
jgi:eukaryotic-like serine/threonine-protein kinase